VSRPLRFEGKTMDAARRKAQESLGTDVSGLSVVRHGRELSGGLLGFFQRERFVIELAEPEAVSQPPSRQSHEETGPSIDARLKALEMLSPSPRVPGESSLSDRLAALAEGTNDTVGVSFDKELRGVLEDAEAVVSDAAGQASFSLNDPGRYVLPPDDLAPPTISFGAAEALGEGFRDRLRAAGLCEEYLPDPLFSHPALALPLRLGTIAPAAVVLLNPGDVLVLVGDVEEALVTAEDLERRIDEDDTVIVVSHRRLGPLGARARAHSPVEAGAMVLERRLAGLVTIIVLDLGCRNDFVPRTVTALRPEAIWAVVEASWDERRARRLEGLVGRLDALVLYGMLSTAHPAGLIGRGWPVAYIDRWEASPLSIAARLVAAVEVAEDGDESGDCQVASKPEAREQFPPPGSLGVGAPSRTGEAREDM
jgi:hypothetical protein